MATSPAGAAAATPAASPGSYARGRPGGPASSVDFGRIFSGLPPFAEANDTVRAALLEVGMPGGIMDAGDQLAAGAEGADRRSDRQRQPDGLDPALGSAPNPNITGNRSYTRAHFLYYAGVVSPRSTGDDSNTPDSGSTQSRRDSRLVRFTVPLRLTIGFNARHR